MSPNGEDHQPVWKYRVSDILWINSVAISDDGGRVVAGTYLHDYKQTKCKFQPNVGCRFATFIFDNDSSPIPWKDEYEGWDGVFGVAVSGDGAVAASGGWYQRTAQSAAGFIRAYDARSHDVLLDFQSLANRVSWVALSADGSILAAAADDVYVFRRVGATFNPVPLKAGVGMPPNPFVSAIAVHPSGKWLVAADQSGNAHFITIGANELSKISWQSVPGVPIPFLSVAIASNAGTFVLGGGSSVYLYEAAPLLKGTAAPALQYAFPPTEVTLTNSEGKPQVNVRWVDISADGSFLTAVANRTLGMPGGNGILTALKPGATRLEPSWCTLLDNAPNSTSIDAAGLYVTASDGYPTGRPSKFYLFDRGGTLRWDYTTYNMNWPMALSADGKWIAAGSDDGTVFCFRP